MEDNNVVDVALDKVAYDKWVKEGDKEYDQWCSQNDNTITPTAQEQVAHVDMKAFLELAAQVLNRYEFQLLVSYVYNNMSIKELAAEYKKSDMEIQRRIDKLIKKLGKFGENWLKVAGFTY